MKRMAPKGKVSSKTWQRIARSHDKVNKIVNQAIELLKFNDNERSRLINIEKEIVKWRAFLRHSRFLKNESGGFVGIYGDPLHPALLDFNVVLQNKRKEFFQFALDTSLENIRYENLKVVSSMIMDEIQPYIFNEEE